MTHIDAFTGEEFTGKAVILSTTEGPEIVDWRYLRGVSTLCGSLTARVEELEESVRRLVEDADAPGPVNTEAAPVDGASVEAVPGPTTVTVEAVQELSTAPVEAVPASTRKAATSTRKGGK